MMLEDGVKLAENLHKAYEDSIKKYQDEFGIDTELTRTELAETIVNVPLVGVHEKLVHDLGYSRHRRSGVIGFVAENPALLHSLLGAERAGELIYELADNHESRLAQFLAATHRTAYMRTDLAGVGLYPTAIHSDFAIEMIKDQPAFISTGLSGVAIAKISGHAGARAAFSLISGQTKNFIQTRESGTGIFGLSRYGYSKEAFELTHTYQSIFSTTEAAGLALAYFLKSTDFRRESVILIQDQADNLAVIKSAGQLVATLVTIDDPGLPNTKKLIEANRSGFLSTANAKLGLVALLNAGATSYVKQIIESSASAELTVIMNNYMSLRSV